MQNASLPSSPRTGVADDGDLSPYEAAKEKMKSAGVEDAIIAGLLPEREWKKRKQAKATTAGVQENATYRAYAEGYAASHLPGADPYSGAAKGLDAETANGLMTKDEWQGHRDSGSASTENDESYEAYAERVTKPDADTEEDLTEDDEEDAGRETNLGVRTGKATTTNDLAALYAEIAGGGTFDAEDVLKAAREKEAKAAEEEAEKKAIWERFRLALQSAGKSSVADLSNTAATSFSVFGGRLWENYNADEAEAAQRRIALYREGLRELKQNDPDYESARSDLENLIRKQEEKIGFFQRVAAAQRGAVSSAQSMSDELSASGARDLEKAKDGAGPLAAIAVDLSASAAGMLGDLALGTLLPAGGLLPLSARSFGAGAREARLAGGSEGSQMLSGALQACKELATEIMSSVALPMKMAYGGALEIGGKSIDELLEAGIHAAVGDGLGGKVAASALGEALEELVGGVLDPAAKAAYDGGEALRKALTVEGFLDMAKEALYQALLGGLLGALGASVEIAADSASGADALHPQGRDGTIAEKAAPAHGELSAPGAYTSEQLDAYAKRHGLEELPVPTTKVLDFTDGRQDLTESLLRSIPESYSDQGLDLFERVRRHDLARGEIKPRSLSAYETRVWYQWQESLFEGKLDKSRPLKTQAEQACELRNFYRNKARELMQDEAWADYLNERYPNVSFERLVAKYSRKLSGDALWEKIIEASTHSRDEVNRLFGLEGN